MGTSSSYGGPGKGTPLVPTWLQPDSSEIPTSTEETPEGGQDSNDAPADRPPVVPPQDPNRFQTQRSNFSRFVSSGGADQKSLGRAISGYVSKSSGGSRQAAQRMGSSNFSGANLINFLSDVRERGVQEALRSLNLETLAGKPIEDIFIGLSDYICEEGGTVDEGIARDAFIETIADLAESGITDLDSLNIDQVQTVLELFLTHSIEARLCNDIGTKIILLPQNVRIVADIQAQLRDFIRRGVSDSLTNAREEMINLAPETALAFVRDVYEQAFSILEVLAEGELV